MERGKYIVLQEITHLLHELMVPETRCLLNCGIETVESMKPLVFPLLINLPQYCKVAIARCSRKIFLLEEPRERERESKMDERGTSLLLANRSCERGQGNFQTLTMIEEETGSKREGDVNRKGSNLEDTAANIRNEF